jgi:hypothetical protein
MGSIEKAGFMSRDWWAKNASGLIASSLVAISFYALTSWVRGTVTQQLQNYVSVATWQTWAQERGEWRGKVDARLEAHEKDMLKIRDEIMRELQALTVEVKVMNKVMTDHVTREGRSDEKGR